MQQFPKTTGEKISGYYRSFGKNWQILMNTVPDNLN